uniref:F5/8 type C domain-containing protein n=1 Tax=Cyprinodon variegatus TaxID=28743 RepID=A0A3Q2E2I1_CYPVA
MQLLSKELRGFLAIDLFAGCPTCLSPFSLTSSEFDKVEKLQNFIFFFLKAERWIKVVFIFLCPGNWEPRLARLDMTGYYNAWMGKGTRSWLQVDLLRPTLLHGIQTQGVRSKLRDHYTAIFSVSYTVLCITVLQIFRGNLDSTKVKDNSFSPPFVARYVRIHPHGYKQKPALRLELLGCDLNSCSLPLGLEKGLIPDSSLNASSFYWSFMRSWRPSLARLHQSGGANAWRPKVLAAGGFGEDQTGHRCHHSRHEEALTVFEPPLFAHYLRIHPRGWVNDIALRLEVLGCDTQQGVGRQRTNTP